MIEKLFRFVTLNIRLATFDFVQKHPGHCMLTVRTFMPISVLVELIGEKARVISGELRIYSDK